MSHHDQDDHSFDQAMRRLHMQAVDQVSPATRARLRFARQAATTATAYDADTALATLDENPDLYLWLASNDDAMPALDP